MNWDQIIQSAAVAVLTALVGVVARWLGIKMDESRTQKATWAIEQGVAYAAEKFRNMDVTGVAKKQIAIQAAESLAPKAMSKLDSEQKSLVVDATYAKMRSSLPQPSAFVLRGEALDQQAEDLGATRPLPRPGALPKMPK